ncbi:MAG: L-2-hydroxyglutarate oxidase [Chloroflexi bacterium]|nr:L-2-hydroxyglutarate oxidase [Chloroflexota bacterium]|tara:strand:- start:1738 stop:2931 length:1194 start_codon:yes stop_codon:yes gene_type:complete
MKKFDISIIGGGIVGLATAMYAKEKYPEKTICVFEKENILAKHQTGNNSGVIHAGIYYQPNSQKAKFCWPGSLLLRKFCDQNEIEYEMCGKLIIATKEDEIERLNNLHERGLKNGVEGLELIDKQKIKEIEPYVEAIKGLWSPNTGIIDYKKLTEAYANIFNNNGGLILKNHELMNIEENDKSLILETNIGEYETNYLINCSGLFADRVAKMMDLDFDVRIVPFRGEYYTLTNESEKMVNGLIYPVPDPDLPFLGVHFTKRINGEVEAGPNAVMAYSREGYKKFDINLKDMYESFSYTGFWKMVKSNWKTGLSEQYRSLNKLKFVKSLQTLIPSISSKDLTNPGAGVRAQAIDKNGNLLQDFSIVKTNNSLHVLSAPSPGATSSLKIAEHLMNEITI